MTRGRPTDDDVREEIAALYAQGVRGVTAIRGKLEADSRFAEKLPSDRSISRVLQQIRTQYPLEEQQLDEPWRLRPAECRDCHAVVETKRGHHLGRVIWEGAAAPDTGIPGEVGGQSGNRVIRAPVAGAARWSVEIGDAVVAGQVIGRVGEAAVEASIGGVVRGLIADGHPAESGLKLADIDPRGDAAVTLEISDKALAVGGGVLEAVLTWLNRRRP